jgi:adenosine deaminase
MDASTTTPGLDLLIDEAPKVEFHIHLEGTLEPEMVFALAARNGVGIRWDTVDELKAAYRFTDLQSFLDLYYECTSVLVTERDFHDLTAAYLDRCLATGIRHVEPSFDPQAHTSRGVALRTVVEGVTGALSACRREHGLTSRLIMSFLRDRSEADALATLDEAEPFLDLIDGVGLDSAEVGNPPGKFVRAFARARESGLHAVAHAGEEGPASYVRDSLDLLHVERIDHGHRAMDDPDLTARLVRDRVPIAVTPLSNVCLRNVTEMSAHPLKRMLDAGLAVSVHSDDPAYFGGYMVDNLRESARELELTVHEVASLLANGIRGSWLESTRQTALLLELDQAFEAAAAADGV